MRSIGPGTDLVDLEFQGHPEYIACYVLRTGAGIALVDPGPASTIEALEEGLRLEGLSMEAVSDLLLTHIHLDHAGAAGTLVEANPDIRVHVHRRGARHLVDPSRLLASAKRLYGERMDELWGEVLPVPQRGVHALDGGETLELGNRRLEVAYTPGHAVHHLSYFDPEAGLAWVGDTLGIRIDNRPYVLPVTPPPDIDLEAWDDSHERIRSWSPTLVCPTHFGPARPADGHIAEHEERLARWSERVARDLESEADDAELARAFAEDVRAELEEDLAPGDVPSYMAGGGIEDSWHGLARYWRKREA